MAVPMELVIPLALAAYGGWTEWNKCTGPADPNPYVATFCSTLRDSMNEACTSVLALPVPSTGVQITARRTITPIAFGQETRNTIKATYGACKDFWTGEITYPQYRSRLEDYAAKLDLLYAAVAPQAPSASPFRTAMASTTVTDDKVQGAAARLKEEVDRCASKDFPCESGNAPIAVTKKDLEDLEQRLGQQIAALRTPAPPPKGSGSDKSTSNAPAPAPAPVPPDFRWTLVTEVGFDSGSAALKRPETCSRIVERLVTHLGVAVPGPVHVRVVGYADATGPVAANLQLSTRRSETVLRCLGSAATRSFVLERAEGAGEIQVPNDLGRLARRASVYVRSGGSASGAAGSP